MIRPRILGSESFALDRQSGTIPIDLRETMQANDDFTIELPPGYALDEMPEPVKLDLGFASYESQSELSGNSLHYTRTYTVREVSLPADRYQDIQKLAAIIDADEKAKLSSKRNDSAAVPAFPAYRTPHVCVTCFTRKGSCRMRS